MQSIILYDTISGVKVGNFTPETLWESVKNTILSGITGVVVAINPEKIMQANRDEKMQQILSSFDFPIADGIGIVLISKLRRGNIKHRITGVSTMEFLVDHSREINASLFFYGAKPGVAERTIGKLKTKYPNIMVVGYIDGYQEDQNLVIDQIKASKANIVFVALGSPRQEHFMYQCKERGVNCLFQGVGGSFDVISGIKMRAPIFFQKLGLEWLYRLICEPGRIKRQIDIVRFLFHTVFMKDKTINRAKSQNT